MTKRQRDALRWIHDYAETRGMSPTIQEVASGLGISGRYAQDLIESLRDQGYIAARIHPRAHRSIMLSNNGREALDASKVRGKFQ